MLVSTDINEPSSTQCKVLYIEVHVYSVLNKQISSSQAYYLSPIIHSLKIYSNCKAKKGKMILNGPVFKKNFMHLCTKALKKLNLTILIVQKVLECSHLPMDILEKVENTGSLEASSIFRISWNQCHKLTLE